MYGRRRKINLSSTGVTTAAAAAVAQTHRYSSSDEEIYDSESFVEEDIGFGNLQVTRQGLLLTPD